jgi:hypothetical protein
MLYSILDRLWNSILDRVWHSILDRVLFARKWKRLNRLSSLLVSDLGNQVQLGGYFLWNHLHSFGGFIVFDACGGLEHVDPLQFKDLRVIIDEVVLVEAGHILPFLPVNFIDHTLHYTHVQGVTRNKKLTWGFILRQARNEIVDSRLPLVISYLNGGLDRCNWCDDFRLDN